MTFWYFPTGRAPSSCLEHRVERKYYSRRGRMACPVTEKVKWDRHNAKWNRMDSVRALKRAYDRSDAGRARAAAYRWSDKGRARETRQNWARSLAATRERITRKAEQIRQLEAELEVALRG